MPRPMLPHALALTLAIALTIVPLTTVAGAQTPGTPPPDATEPAMDLERLGQIIMALDPQAQGDGRIWQMAVGETAVLIVTDAHADRMRAITPIRKVEGMSQAELTRLLQADFDSALDARYAIAKGILWAAFIHPLSPLEKNEFISGLGQVVNLAQSYGTLYSGGALQYGGGDSGALQRQLIDDLLKKGEEI